MRLVVSTKAWGPKVEISTSLLTLFLVLVPNIASWYLQNWNNRRVLNFWKFGCCCSRVVLLDAQYKGAATWGL